MFAQKFESNENVALQILPVNEGIASAARELLNTNPSYKSVTETLTGGLVKSGIIPELTLDLGIRSPIAPVTPLVNLLKASGEVNPVRVNQVHDIHDHHHQPSTQIEPPPPTTAPHSEHWGKRTFSVAQDGSSKYHIAPGDTLSSIAIDVLHRKHKDDPGWKLSHREMFDMIKELAKANHLQNPDLIIAGKNLIIPKELVDGNGKHTRQQEPERTPQKRHEPEQRNEKQKEPEKRNEKQQEPEKSRIKNNLLEVHNNTSPEFQKRVEKEVEQMDPKVRALLEKNGYKIVVGKSITDVRPDLKGVVPRGYPPGYSWDNADGLQDSTRKQIIVTEFIKQNGQWNKSDRTEGVIRHETAHAVDHCLGDFSNSEQFKKAYDADVAKIPAADRAKLAYLLQPGEAGRSEAFAEVLAGLNGKDASAGPEMRALIRKYFTNSEAQLKERLAKA